MPRSSTARDIRGECILLGTGTSVGVPVIGCACPVCRSGHPRNQRTRCSALFGLPGGNLLIDTPPDLRSQLLRERIGIIHAVAYTHEHADHLFGMDDLRIFQFQLGHAVPVHCEPTVETRIRRCFDYAFSDHEPTHQGAAPAITFHPIGLDPFDTLGATVVPLRLRHGPRFEVLGFRIGDVAYCTDTNGIPDETFDRMRGLDVLVLDALRATPHATHFSLDEAIAVAGRIGARKTYFTHISCRLDYETTNAILPAGMELAYDGLVIPFA
ncbi:MAG: MBL fold metallo-hydrolase [Planctomycetes bacterium]|nr:MBL fold metallo-hydrolase [Planctomycetota bacterium]